MGTYTKELNRESGQRYYLGLSKITLIMWKSHMNCELFSVFEKNMN